VRECYSTGVAIGLATAIGIVAGAVFPGRGVRAAAAVVLAGAAGFACGWVLSETWAAVLAAAAAAVTAFGASSLAGRARSGGGTRAGVGFLLAAAAVVAAALALVPFVGFVEPLAASLLSLRLRRGGPRRYAGLRILARD